jgi:Tfp pilus assembly protein PilN
MRAVNLLPVDHREKHAGRLPSVRRNPVVLAVVAALVLVALALGALTHSADSSVTSKRARLAQLEQRLAAVPRPKPVNGELASVTARVTAVGTAAGKRLPWDAFLGDLSRVVPEDVWLLSLQGSSPDAAPAADAATATTPGAAAAFTVSGYTYSQPSVARLMKRLALVPWLSNVQLQSSVKSQIGSRSVYQFTIVSTVLNPEVVS